MAVYRDFDYDLRINGKLTVNGELIVPSSNLTVNGVISGNSFKGDGSQLTNLPIPVVSSTPVDGSTSPISSDWAYDHSAKSGVGGGHLPTAGTTSQYLRGDGSWAIPPNTNNYVSSVSSTNGGRGTLTINRSGLTALTLDLAHNHDDSYYTESEITTLLLGKSDTGHTHDFVDLTSKPTTLSGYGITDGALATHNHDSTYLKLTGGTITGPIYMTPTGNNTPIASVFGTNNTNKSYINFNASSGSNDPGYIMHETSGITAVANYGVIHLAPTDDNSRGDYVAIHGSNDPETIKIHTDGYVETPSSVKADSGFIVGSTTVIGSDALIDWDRIKNEPSTYTPSAHTHLWQDITDKPTTFAPSTHNHDSSYLKLTGGTISGKLTVGSMGLSVGEGLEFLNGDANYFGTNLDARIIRMTDANGSNGGVDGGIVFESHTPTDGISVELLRIRNSEFKWKGNDIWNAGNFNPSDKEDILTFSGTGATTVSRNGNTITISSTDTNTDTWRPIDNTATLGNTSNSISSDWASKHEDKTGLLGHIPSGGTTSQYLRGDGTWVAPPNTNYYVSSVSSTNGGRGTLTLNRSGLTALTVDLSHNHDDVYYTETEVNNLLADKSDVGHTHDYDKYQNWKLQVNGGTTEDIGSLESVNFVGSGATSITRVGNTITVSSTDTNTDTNTWRPIDATPINGNTSNSVSSDWAYDHENATGLGKHIPNGGTTSQYLRGDGTWVIPPNTNNYVSSVSSTNGGKGTLTLNRSGLTALTIDLAHNHDDLYFTEDEITTKLAGYSLTTHNHDSDYADIGHNHDSVYMKLSGGTFTGQVSFNTPTYVDTVTKSPAIRFDAQSDWHLIYVENYSASSSRLVIESADDGGADYTTIRSKHYTNGDLDVADFKRELVDINVNLNAKAGLDVTGDITVTGTVDGVDIATHASSTGVSGHIPTGGTTSQYLRGDGTWSTPPNTNNYVSSVSSTAGGNGTLTLNRSGLTALTLNLAHTHSEYLEALDENITMGTGFSVKGSMFVGTNGSYGNIAGNIFLRNGSGSNVIQITGDGSTKSAGVKAYISASGDATFDGTLTANSLAITSAGVIDNLNAEMVGGVTEAELGRRQTAYELGGSGVHIGLQVTQYGTGHQTQVTITNGVAYTSSGKRVEVVNQSLTLVGPSSTTNSNRYDAVYIAGPSEGNNEGDIKYVQGSYSLSPTAPSIPSDGILLAHVYFGSNQGTITDSKITDKRAWKPVKHTDGYLDVDKLRATIVDSYSSYVDFKKPIKGTGFAKSVTISAGSKSSTWTHNLGLGTSYAVMLSSNSSEPHVYWSSKSTNSIVINLDDLCETDVVVDVVIVAY